jgi:hypothetical protein
MASPPTTKLKKLVPSRTPKYWKGISDLASLQGTRNTKGYAGDSDAEWLAVAGRYEFLKKCRSSANFRHPTLTAL